MSTGGSDPLLAMGLRQRLALSRRLERAAREESRRQRRGVLARLESAAAAGGVVSSLNLLETRLPCADLHVEGARVRLIGVHRASVAELSVPGLRLESVADQAAFFALYFSAGASVLPLLAARAQVLPAGGGRASRPTVGSTPRAGQR